MKSGAWPQSVLLLAWAGVAAGGCGRPTVQPVLRVVHDTGVLSLDPIASRDAATHSVLSNLFEGLVTFDRDMRLVPALAINWSSVDEHTWLIELRKGVRFHNGHPLSAEDVKFTLERATNDPASAVKSHLASLESVEVVSASSLRLRTRRPDPLLMNRLTYILVGPAGVTDVHDRPVGTGPYRLLRQQPDGVLEAEAFADYWGGRPRVQSVRFATVEEGERQLEVLQRGEADVLRWVAEPLALRARAIPGVRVTSRFGLSTYYLWINTEPRKAGGRNPFADRRVRQAISLALDRKRLIEELGGNGEPAFQVVQPGVFGHVASLPDLVFDPVRARALLEEAGYPQGFEATLTHRAQSSMTAIANGVSDMLGAVGIRLKLETPDWPVVNSGWQNATLPFFLAGWRFETGDAASFLRDCLYTRDAGRHSGAYNAGFSNPKLDALIDENDQVFGETKRLKQYERLMRLAMDEMPVVPLYHRLNLYGVASRVRWEPRLDGKLLAVEMAFE